VKHRFRKTELQMIWVRVTYDDGTATLAEVPRYYLTRPRPFPELQHGGGTKWVVDLIRVLKPW
jgi:hypothetical protein